MYILSSFKDVCSNELVKDLYWVDDPKIVFEYCEKHGYNVDEFSPQGVFLASLDRKRLRKATQKKEGIFEVFK